MPFCFVLYSIFLAGVDELFNSEFRKDISWWTPRFKGHTKYMTKSKCLHYQTMKIKRVANQETITVKVKIYWHGFQSHLFVFNTEKWS